MSLNRMLFTTLLMTGLVAACSKSPSGDSSASVTNTVVTGIADCDNFLNAYEQCLSDKIPAESRAQMKTGMDSWKSAWKSMADNPATRDQLPQICKQAREATVPALKAYGCDL